MNDYFKVGPQGISQFQLTAAYLGGSAIQTIVDNPVTAYRQLVQQYAKNAHGVHVDPKIASQEAMSVFKKNPIGASCSGLIPRLVGVGLKRIPKFTSLLGISFMMNGNGKAEEPGVIAATGAGILSAPFINPVRMIEKQQRVDYKVTGKEKPIWTILKESSQQNFRPLFRGTIPLMMHSLASALLGLVGQPVLQKKIESELYTTGYFGRLGCNLFASSIVSPIYVTVTNPIARLEVIMQTAEIKNKHITLGTSHTKLVTDASKFGMRGAFRGNGLGIMKATISLSLFHEGRMFCTDLFKSHNKLYKTEI